MTIPSRAPPSTAGPARQSDRVAAQLRGFGPLGLLAILVIIAADVLGKPFSALLVLAWAWRSRTPWPEIGYVRPRSWIAPLAGGIAFGIAFKLLMKAVVMPLLGADPVNHAYQFLVENRAALPGMIYAVTVGAGFGEETLFRGFMFERLRKLIGSGSGAQAAIVLATSVVFGLVHYPEQGITGTQQATIVGLVLGTIYAIYGRIWFPMATHAAFDLTALAMIYWGVEADVAQLFFK